MINTTAFGFLKKYGLLISDTDVTLVSWKGGELEKIAVFSNDEDGLGRFGVYMKTNQSRYRGKGFYILSNIIGEDYRIEKVAHLIGKYKTDFHTRRMQQLFRGSTLCMSTVQGREERGKREDIVLFYGLLTENKVLPWITAITRGGNQYLAGVYGTSFVSKEILQGVKSDWGVGNNLLMTIHEKGLLRQTFFSKGQPRFSRVSKIDDSSAETVSVALRKELERTIQYLNSLKISTAGGVSVELICPGNMVGQLREMVKSGEKIKFNFRDSAFVGNKIKMKNVIAESGKDSSLALHSMFSYLRWHQLAPLSFIRFYWMKLIGNVSMALFVAYGLFASVNPISYYLDGYAIYQSNQDLSGERNIKQRNYDDEAQLSQDPPSKPENIAAVSKTFRLLSKLQIEPSQLFYYFSRSFADNKLVSIDNMRWYITDETNNAEARSEVLFNGSDLFQVLEISGQILPVAGETYINVADRAEDLVKSLDQGRSDIAVVPVELPSRELDQTVLGGVLSDDFAVDAARNRNFKIRIIWKEYPESKIESMTKEI